jgi:hypothetical protein
VAHEPDAPVTGRPVLTVVRGNPDAEQLAALVLVLAARPGQPAEPARRPVSQWSARSRLMRSAPPAGPGAWRASALPG